MVTDPPYGVSNDPACRERAGVNLNSTKNTFDETAAERIRKTNGRERTTTEAYRPSNPGRKQRKAPAAAE